jgi:hypothetical protein
VIFEAILFPKLILKALNKYKKNRLDSGEVPSSYFSADSYIGSFYITEPGEYNLQVISEKVVSKNAGIRNSDPADDTMLMSVILIPLTR